VQSGLRFFQRRRLVFLAALLLSVRQSCPFEARQSPAPFIILQHVLTLKFLHRSTRTFDGPLQKSTPLRTSPLFLCASPSNVRDQFSITRAIGANSACRKPVVSILDPRLRAHAIETSDQHLPAADGRVFLPTASVLPWRI
jgi:hypothetical protein